MRSKVLSMFPFEQVDITSFKRHVEIDEAKLQKELDRAEENKTFCIGFPTQPRDDTGVFHILEHSVLCGSAHYPVREPFVELMKTSLNTFLNAITFPDKTIYPISSRNEQDFHNLMQVYLDAVFHPLLLEKPEIFAQEGWHYELDGDQVRCKGVVFNEMKGVFSSPDSLLEYEVNRRLFPDTCYRWVSGGDPEHIPRPGLESLYRSPSAVVSCFQRADFSGRRAGPRRCAENSRRSAVRRAGPPHPAVPAAAAGPGGWRHRRAGLCPG